MHLNRDNADFTGIEATARSYLRLHLDSPNPLFWAATETAAICEKAFGWLTLPLSLARHWRDVPNVLRLRSAIASGIPVVAFDVSREYFDGMYKPIMKEIGKRYGCWKIIPNDAPRKDVSEIHSCWSLFVPWSAYISCWFSTHHPNVLNMRNARTTVEIYHGVAAKFMSAKYKAHSGSFFRRELKKFDVHFATGREMMEFAQSLGGRCFAIGYPKTDFLFRDEPCKKLVADDCSFPEKLPIVVYAPHHHVSSSIARSGTAAIEALLRADVNVLVKLHGFLSSPDAPFHSFHHAVENLAATNPRVRLARDSEPGHYYKLADAVVGDAGSSSTGFESLLAGTPAILLRDPHRGMPEIGSVEYVVAGMCDSVDSVDELPAAVSRALALPERITEERRVKAASLLYNPGTATQAAVETLTKLIEPDPASSFDSELSISVVIPAYNEERQIGDCIRSVLALGEGSVKEIIVVDNNSTDRTADIARSFPRVTVVSEKTKGLPRARQKGLDVATGDLYAAIDADVRIDPLWELTVRRRFASEQNLVSLAGPYQFYDLAAWKMATLWMLEKIFAVSRTLLGKKKIIYARGGNSVYRTAALRKIGGFNVNIDFYGEDRDTLQRIAAVGRVDFDLGMSASTSARRLNNEGFFRTILLTKANALWQQKTNKPFIVKQEIDWR